QGLEPQVGLPGAILALDYDASEGLDRSRVIRADDRTDRVGVPRARLHLPRGPLRRVRVQERPDDRASVGERLESLEGSRVDLVKDLLLGGQDRPLALEFRPCQVLDPGPLRGDAGLLFLRGEELRSLLPRFLKETRALRLRRLADGIRLLPPADENLFDDGLEAHQHLSRHSIVVAYFTTALRSWMAITRPKTMIVSGITMSTSPRLNSSGFSAMAPTVAPPTTFSAHAVAIPVPAIVS